MHQMLRIAERIEFNCNLDYLRWLISYGWNKGIQKYKHGITATEEARNYIQFCYQLVQQLSHVKTKKIELEIQQEAWEAFGIFLEMVGPKMEEANSKLMYM